MTPPTPTSEVKAYVWAFQHFRLYVTEHDSLQEAARMSWFASSAGSESLQCIEVPAEGRVYSSDDVYSLWAPLEAAEDAELEARPRNVAKVTVRSLVGDQCGIADVFPTWEAAEAEADRLRSIFGDRVSVEEVKGW